MYWDCKRARQAVRERCFATYCLHDAYELLCIDSGRFVAAHGACGCTLASPAGSSCLAPGSHRMTHAFLWPNDVSYVIVARVSGSWAAVTVAADTG